MMLPRASATTSIKQSRKHRLSMDRLKMTDRTGGLPTSWEDKG